MMKSTAETAKGGFTGNWRPFIGWTCGVALAYEYVLRPIVGGIARVFGASWEFPTLDMATLMPLVLGMIGLIASRSYDKKNGVAS